MGPNGSISAAQSVPFSALSMRFDDPQCMAFGAYLLRSGLVTGDELETAFAVHAEHNEKIGKLARRRQLLNYENVSAILQHQKQRHVPFGEAAIELGFLSKPEVDQLLRTQTDSHVPIGQILVDLGVLTREKLFECKLEYSAFLGEVPGERPHANGCGCNGH